MRRVRDWLVRVPASSANVGPAFDAVAVALERHVEVTDRGVPAPETHPAVRAFRRAGGEGPLVVGATFPGGRGLGYSGACRIAGLLAAVAQRGGETRDARAAVLRDATDLEGHADNAAASLHGGVVAVAAGHVVRIPLGQVPQVVVWIPDRETATASSRALLPDQIPFDDAVFNIARTALLVAALAAGDVDALRTATEDHLHQDRRLARVPDSRAAIDAALRAGAWGAWLSGSGPSVAAFADPDRAHHVAATLPPSGRTHILGIDDQGATVA